jgi:3-carboxy-cis,cis-muconate cycloisomerase
MSTELFDAIFGTIAVTAAVDDAAIVSAMCEAETALARACARADLIRLPVALEVGAACQYVARIDAANISRRAVSSGNPVVPLVEEIRSRVRERAGDEAARAVHLGATSQDILDTALMLVAKRALGVVVAEMDECGSHIADLAATYRSTPMSGRTLLQQAVPTTFGALAAVWGEGIDAAARRLAAIRATLPVQLGGAAGTLAPLHPAGLAVLAAFADELDLAEPVGVWHGNRAPVVELAGALGSAAAPIAKVATDIVLLSQNEVGELAESNPGGSSSMPHKRNPTAAITARAAAAQVPGLVATLLATSSPELQRGAGSWHAEWPALLSALRYVGGAASRLRTALHLDVDTTAMARNLAALEGIVDTADLGHAADLVDRYLAWRKQ